jgi:DNA excision repair protein ERCC-2
MAPKENDIYSKPFFSIGITDLVYFTKRSGDLKVDLSTYGRQRLMEGLRLHQKVQHMRPDTYHAEVALSKLIEFDEFVLEIKGRADGIDFDQKPPVIEEIKSHTADYKDIEESQKNLHWAQLYFYAWMLTEEIEELEMVDLHLTYIHVSSEKIKTDKRIFKIDEIDYLCGKMIDKFKAFLLIKINREKARNSILLKQNFPLPRFREGQRDLAAAVYSTVKRKDKLFIEAPTGMGKTIGSIFPALKAMGEGIFNQLFFLTAKGTGKEAAVKAVNLMNKENNALNTIVITSKSKICFNPEKACDPEECAYCRGYFDKIDDAVKSIHQRYQFKGQEQVKEVALEYQICPFEFSLDLIMSSDVVVCDYNYAFDPRVHLKRIFDEENKDVVILADESHNLVSRARDMYSSEIDENEVAEGKKRWSKESEEIKRAYNRVMRYFKKLREEYEESEEEIMIKPEGPDQLTWSLRELMHAFDRFNKKNPKFKRKKEFMEDFFYYLSTVRIWEIYGKGHTTVISRSGKKISVKLLCLDPSDYVAETTNLTGGAVFFSGTLTPIEFYKKSLFGDRKVWFKRFLSPFPKENVHVSAVTHISTKYKDREYTLDELCKTIRSVTACKTGNYLIFCPSFAYLEDIVFRFEELFPDHNSEILKQVNDMTMHDREIFLDRFEESRDHTLLGFVVSAGVFGEGIDLVSDKLIGAVVVGVSLPGINAETDAVKDYYTEKYNQGFEFAYQYPGINRVLQNSGRVIRTETDKGIICFIGRRYARLDYRRFMPKHWDVNYVSNRDDLERLVQEFWKQVGKSIE